MEIKKLAVGCSMLLIFTGCSRVDAFSFLQDDPFASRISSASKLGLPPVPIPEDNPQNPAKIQLGQLLFNDLRFSATGDVGCVTCHALEKAGTDGLTTSRGINGLTGTRNSPPTVNAAFFSEMFWDGRVPDFEEQSKGPPVNPVEMGLASYEPIVEIMRTDRIYRQLLEEAFAIDPAMVTIDHFAKAVAAFERTLVAGNSRFDRWYFENKPTLTEQEIRGFDVFIGDGRCVSCHVIETDQALFTDNKFHNIGVGINKLPTPEVEEVVAEFLDGEYTDLQLDQVLLMNDKVSELGRFAKIREIPFTGAFKTSTLRNIELTAPYMHDGSLKTLEETVLHYNRGGASSDIEPVNPYLSGGIRVLDLTEDQIADLVAFMKTLTSEVYEQEIRASDHRNGHQLSGGTTR